MSDLRIQSFDFAAAVARAGLRPDGTPRTDATGAAPGGFRAAMNTIDDCRVQLQAMTHFFDTLADSCVRLPAANDSRPDTIAA